MKVHVHSSFSQLERWGWTAVKTTFVVVVLSLVVNPSTKGRADRGEAGLETVLPAAIRAGDLYSLAAALPGRVTQLTVTPGQAVEAGRVLAVIENAELEGLIERAARRVELLSARVGRRPASGAAASGPQQRWLDEQLRAAEKGLDASRQRAADFSLSEAEQAWTKARQAADRIRSLSERQLATSHELEDAERTAQNEFRNLTARREQAARLRQELDAAESQVRMARLQVESARGSSAVDGAAQLDYEEAVAAHRSLVERREALRLVATRPGTVLQVNAASGDMVTAGTVLVQVANQAMLHFDVSAQASVARSVRPGDPVVVRVPVDPPFDVPARVSQVLLQPDPNQQAYLIRVTIPNPAPRALLVGLEGGVSFAH